MTTRSVVQGFSTSQLCEFVAQKLEDVEDATQMLRSLEENKINGKAFLELTDEDLREIVKPIGDRKALKRLASSYMPQPEVSYS